MHAWLLEVLRCPRCGGELESAVLERAGSIEEGVLDCATCGADWPVLRGIPRFVPTDDYTANFGLQWTRFRRTQLDSHTGKPISANRFWKFTGWRADDLEGKLVLDAGCGAGRFAEVALAAGARVVAIDFSSAIDAAKENLQDRGEIEFIQADINAMPFAPATFPFVFCLGVLQHTPNPSISFADLTTVTAEDGRLAVDVYPRLARNIFASKYWIRPFTRRLPPQTTFRLFERCFPFLYALSNILARIPMIGRYLKYLIPVANYRGRFDLSDEHLHRWALLDTFDMWAPAFDLPQSQATLRRWFDEGRFQDIEVFRDGFLVGRGIKRLTRNHVRNCRLPLGANANFRGDARVDARCHEPSRARRAGAVDFGKR